MSTKSFYRRPVTVRGTGEQMRDGQALPLNGNLWFDQAHHHHHYSVAVYRHRECPQRVCNDDVVVACRTSSHRCMADSARPLRDQCHQRRRRGTATTAPGRRAATVTKRAAAQRRSAAQHRGHGGDGDVVRHRTGRWHGFEATCHTHYICGVIEWRNEGQLSGWHRHCRLIQLRATVIVFFYTYDIIVSQFLLILDDIDIIKFCKPRL